MRNLLLAALISTLISAVAGEGFLYQEPLAVPFEDSKVPGKNPVEICSLSPAEDLVTIKYINITPNPPLAGQNLTIDAVALLKTKVTEGSYAQFEVKYGFVKLLSGTADLCEKATEVELECPVGPGEVHIQKTVQLPSAIPPVLSTILVRLTYRASIKLRLTCTLPTTNLSLV
jgi:ML domain